MALAFDTSQTAGTAPAQARDLLPHQAGEVFLGWTYQIPSIFPWRTRWYFIRPDGTDAGLPCLTLLDAVNQLRGPHGLPALYDEYV